FVYNAAGDVAKSLPDLLFYPFLAEYMPYERMFFVNAAFGIGVAAVILAGIWKHFSSTDRLLSISVTEIYVVVYAIGALSWTVHGERYLLPILPILLWGLLKGTGRWRTTTAVALILLGLGG